MQQSSLIIYRKEGEKMNRKSTIIETRREMRDFIIDNDDRVMRGLPPKRLICITHPGVFHADDVFSAAFMAVMSSKIFSELSGLSCVNVRIERGDPDKIIDEHRDEYDSLGFVIFDIGYGKFDHHRANSETRPDSTENNPLPYASFGLLWREFSPLMFDEDFVYLFDNTFVRAIDLADNGVVENLLSSTISAMNPNWDTTPFNEFAEAVCIANKILMVHFDRYLAEKKAKITLEECYRKPRSNENILILPKYIPYQKFLSKYHPDITYVIYPSSRNLGEWCISPVDPGKHPLPESWTREKIIGMTFCHKARFLARFNFPYTAILAITKK